MSITKAIQDLRAGRPVLVADDASRENEVDVILAAQTATAEQVAWLIRHTSGYLCAPMPIERAQALSLPLMVAESQDPRGTAYTVSVDAARGVSTGISAADRARTLRVLADPASRPEDLIRPGHVLPLRAVDGGLAQRAGHTEASVQLCRLAGLSPVAAIAELVADDGSMLRLAQAKTLAEEASLTVVTIAELAAWHGEELQVEPVAARRVVAESGREARLPTAFGDFVVRGYRDLLTGATHVVLVSASGVAEVPPVRVHSECLTGDALGSLRCDCGDQLQAALRIAADEGGVVIYLGGHEGRGIGLAAKLAAYSLQDDGADTVAANLELGHQVDEREYGAAAAIVTELGLNQVRLLTNNPEKADALRAAGIAVSVERLEVAPGPHNDGYLRTKRTRLGHLLSGSASANIASASTSASASADLAEVI
jgi:3,4-dihydroxy 2-butanone 4-phosphate synthase / GTP cyclohydrolase II